MPFLRTLNSSRLPAAINRHCHKCRVLIRIMHMRSIQIYPSSVMRRDLRNLILTAIESILLGRSSIIRNLYPRSPLRRVLKQIHIRPLIESMMRRFRRRRPVEVMYICKAAAHQHDTLIRAACRAAISQRRSQIFSWSSSHFNNHYQSTNTLRR